MYSLPSHIASNNIFVINFSDLENRLEAEYYAPSIRETEKIIRAKSSKKLRDFIQNISSGATPSVKEEDKYYATSDDGIPFLRVQNLNPNGQLDLEDVKHINKETHENYLRRSQVKEGDLLIKITGVGRMAIASVAPKDFIGNTNQHMVVIRTGDSMISEYLASYLNLDIVEKLATRRATGATRPALDYPALKSIPIVENVDFSILEKALKQKTKKDKEAQLIFDKIETFILNELEIKVPRIQNKLKDRTTNSLFSEVSGGRIDPDYHSEKYKRILEAIGKSKYPLVSLKDLTSFLNSGKTPSSSQYSEEETVYPLIKVGSYGGNYIKLDKVDYAITNQPYEIEKGDIFILSAAHQSQYVGRHIKYLQDNPNTQTSFVGELICLRANDKVEPYYMYSVLNTEVYKTLLNREKTGQTSHIYAKDIKHIQIPFPPREKQQEIIVELDKMIAEIDVLRQEQNKIISTAIAKIEKQLLA